MKQIEKLADSFWREVILPRNPGMMRAECVTVPMAYVAGFLKAREMAKQEALTDLAGMRKYPAGKSLVDVIEALGESEAEDNTPVYDIVEDANKALSDLKKRLPGSFALVCVNHPIMRDDLCSTCWEAKHRNDSVLKSQPGMNAVGVEI